MKKTILSLCFIAVASLSYGNTFGNDISSNLGNVSTNLYASNNSPSYYTSMYSRWENNAKRAYNSLTRASMNSSTYMSLQKSLRQAQSEMRSIRSQAARNGVNISQSPWETATVSVR